MYTIVCNTSTKLGGNILLEVVFLAGARLYLVVKCLLRRSATFAGSAVEVVEANAGNEVHPCKQRVSEEVSQPGSLEVSIGLPESFFEAFKQSDVTIDMEYNAEADTFNSAAVTLDDGVQETSFNGQGEEKSL